MGRKLLIALVVLVVLYLSVGVVFHVLWKNALAECDRQLQARGEFVEPEVFAGPIGLFFDMTFWPVYARANLYHFGTIFSTPCNH